MLKLISQNISSQKFCLLIFKWGSWILLEVATRGVLWKNVFLRPKLPKACNFIKKETLGQVFSCEFCESSKNTFSYRAPLAAASIMECKFKNKLTKLKYHFFQVTYDADGFCERNRDVLFNDLIELMQSSQK